MGTGLQELVLVPSALPTVLSGLGFIACPPAAPAAGGGVDPTADSDFAPDATGAQGPGMSQNDCFVYRHLP